VLLQRKPVCYQESAGERVEVPAAFTLVEAKETPADTIPTIGFHVGRYDSTRPLVIDPVLQYSTYLGGSNNDEAVAVETDSQGRLYVAGSTFSADFPTTSGRAQGDQPTVDAFLVVLDPSRSGAASLVYGTFVGGAGGDSALDLAVDAEGQAYLTGVTNSADFPATPGALPGGTDHFDAFVTVVNPTRSGTASLVFSSPIGGSGIDLGASLAVDGTGRIHLAGETRSTDFPVTAGALQSTLTGGTEDAFVAVISLDALNRGSIDYATYLGGAAEEHSFAIAVDALGRSYVTGNTTSPDFPTTASRISGRGFFTDAFLSVIDASLAGITGLTYSTYLSGKNDDGGVGIAVDSDGVVYVAGFTYSSDYPVTADRFRGDLPDVDGMLSIIDPTRPGIEALVYSTYVGGAGVDAIDDVVVLDTGPVLVVGITASADFPISPGAMQSTIHGSDGFITLLDPRKPGGAALLYSTLLGGQGRDECEAATVDRLARVCVAGETQSTDFPTTATRLQGDPGDERPDGFLSVLDFLLEPPRALTAALSGPASVHLSWTDRSFAEAGFLIERRSSSTGFIQIAQVGTDVTAFEDTTVAPNTVYTYRVRAARPNRVTAYSTLATVTTPSAVGGTLEVPQEVNFGKVKRRKEKRVTIAVTNGHASETLTGVVGDPTRGFKVVEGGGAFKLAPGQSGQVTLAVKSAKRGTLRGTLPIESSDPKRQTVEVELKAKIR
jgi:hypothetical protein